MIQDVPILIKFEKPSAGRTRVTFRASGTAWLDQAIQDVHAETAKVQAALDERSDEGGSKERVMIEQIKKAVHAAAEDNQKIAMFHLQILKNAAELEGMNPEAVCQELAVPVTYATEFRKMLSPARLMKEQGIRLA